jgi:hypothetical protein
LYYDENEKEEINSYYKDKYGDFSPKENGFN